MLEDARRELERQLERLLEEAEKPMTIEEMIPHLDPIMPGPNDVADVLENLRGGPASAPVEREGSYWRKPSRVPVDHMFGPAIRDAAGTIVDLLREMDPEGEGTPYPRLVQEARARGVPPDRVLDIVTRLKHAGEVYEAMGSRLRLTKG